MKSVFALASLNVDMVANVANLPEKGETVFSNGFKQHYGGKGANQVMTVSRLGGRICAMGKVGNDVIGRQYIKHFKNNSIDTSYILVDETAPTGRAFINVDDAGNNNIVVISGANAKLSAAEVESAREKLTEASIILSQFEVPVEATQSAFEIGKKNRDAVTIFNPAPVKDIPEDMWGYIDILVPNRGELNQIAGKSLDSDHEILTAARELIKKGVNYVIVTLGEDGAMVIGEEQDCIIPSEKVQAVNTTGAGDSFIGGLAYDLMNKTVLNFQAVKESAEFATIVAAITVQTDGVQDSLPTMGMVKAFLEARHPERLI